MRFGMGLLLLLLCGCGAATDVPAEEAADAPGCPEHREDSTSSGLCASPVCEGIALRVPSGGAAGEGGAPLQVGVTVFNCGSDEAPRCIEVALRVQTADGDSEIVGRSWTSVPLPSGLGEQVRVEAPWESWQDFLDEPVGFCIEAVVDPEGQIAQCSTGKDVSNSLSVLGGDCVDEP